MQSFPGFAERAEAAFGSSALGRSAGAWRVSDTVARFAAGRASDSEGSEEQGGECDDGDGVGLAFCKAFEAEPEEAAEDVLARADSSPPHHNELIDDTEQPGRTVYVLAEPIYVGSGSRGDERGARQHAAALEHDAAEARGGSATEPAAPAERPPQEPVKFHGASRLQRRAVQADVDVVSQRAKASSGGARAHRRSQSRLWRTCQAQQTMQTPRQRTKKLTLALRPLLACARRGSCAARRARRTTKRARE